MTKNEFIKSIKYKIKEYSIPTTTKEAFSYNKNILVYTIYNDGSTELVDIGIEWFLCSKSAYYFISHYGWIPFPGKGDIPYQLYYYQKEILKEAPDYKKLVFLKTRQCLTEENFVMTDRGYISIKDVKIGDKIETLINNKIHYVNIENWMNLGKKKTCQILINSGATIDCTLDHLIMTKEGWKEAGDLTLKDEIISIINKGKFGDYKLERDEYASLIGYYLADGKWNQPYFINTNKKYINEIYNNSLLFEDGDSYIYERKKENKKRVWEIRIVRSKSFKKFWKKYQLNKPLIERCLTNDLMNLNEKQMSILLNRLYTGNGWITYKKDKRRKNYIQYEIGLDSICFKLLKQIEYILQTKYGIHCCIQKIPFNDNVFWKLRITQKKSIIEFINRIGIKEKTDIKEIKNLISKEIPYKTYQSFNKIRKITLLEEVKNVYDITTESSNFLTNGLLVHNCGISTLFALYCLWRCNFHESEFIDVISTLQKKARAFVGKMDPTLKRLPTFLKTEIINRNQSVIRWSNGSQVLSESASERAGRGDSLSLLILDEAAHYLSDRLTRGIIAAAMPTLSITGGDVIIISTPNGTAGAGSYYYEQVNQLQVANNSDRSKLIEIDWWEVPDQIDITPHRGYNPELERAIERGYYHNQKVREEYRNFFNPIAEDWRNNDWLSKQHEELGDILYKQEVIHSFIVGENQVFSDDILERVRKEVNKSVPIIENKLGNAQVKGILIWKLPIPGHRYILGIDVGKGTSNDYSAIEVMDVETYEQVCEFHAKIGTKLFGRLVKKVARYYNEGYIVIECNGIGEAVFNEVYHHDTDSYENVFKRLVTKNGLKIMTGWDTNVKSRKLMTNSLIDWITVDNLWEELKLNSQRLYTEFTTWIWNGDKPDHADGCVSSNTLIVTKEGLKEIKEIKVGDFVLTHKGRFKRVIKTYKFKDKKKQMLEVKAFGKMKIKITSNQEFYIVEDEEEKFKNFEHIYNYKNKLSTCLYSEMVEEIEEIDLIKYNEGKEYDEEYIYYINKYGKRKIRRYLKLDDIMLFFIGHILSNGTISEYGKIGITCNKDEDEIIELYSKYFEKEYDIKINRYNNLSYERFSISNIILWNFFKNIGKKKEKNILKELRYLNERKQMNILYGYLFGDGSFKIGKKFSITAATISKNLYYFITSILYRNKISFNINYENGRKRGDSICNPQYKISILGKEVEKIIKRNKFAKYFRKYKNKYKEFENKEFENKKSNKLTKYKEKLLVSKFYSVKEIEWDDYFYDLTVEEDHSYIANGYIVHNSHDDLIIALGLCLYLRNKAVTFGDSFLINEDGVVIESTEEGEEEVKGLEGFNVALTEEEGEDIFKKRHGCSKKDYLWLIK